MLRSLFVLSMVALLVCMASAADIAPGDVIVKSDIEAFGRPVDLDPIQLAGASGNFGMQLNKPTAGCWGAVKLDPGDYTLLYRVWAPAGDQDGFFVDIRAKRDRRVPPGQRRWHTMAYNFSVKAPESVPVAIIAQELGFVVDQIALVKGTYETNEVRIPDLPGDTIEGPQIRPSELPRFESSAKLAEAPAGPFAEDEGALWHEDFEGDFEGAGGAHRVVDGEFGKALYLDVPDGRYVVDCADMDLASQGTVEFWVKPRVAQQLWWDQGWHFLIHCEPVDAEAGKGVSLSLSRHPMTQLKLEAKAPGGEISDGAAMSTGRVDVNTWHHVLISWDLATERQYLWLMVDGAGKQVEFNPKFTPGPFKRVEIGNSPLSSDLPYLFLDGAIDEVRISGASVADRLAK